MEVKLFSYPEAIKRLNALTSNVMDIKQSKNANDSYKKEKMEKTAKYLEHTGIRSEDLHNLPVIHIAGTKGKGYTSAMTEAIIRSHGFRTGLYTSPHLVSVTERIKIDGRQMDEDYFADVFTEIYNDLEANKEPDGEMPTYFMFLTVMALKVFILEDVDVAIIEVGIGGKYDMTNIVSNVPVVGITSLGLDHTALLGQTIEEIAAQKAGIMKPCCRAYTVPQRQPALKVLFDVARKTECKLNIVPAYEAYNWLDITSRRYKKPENPAKYLNASLAIQLAHSWMNQKKLKHLELRKNFQGGNYDIEKVMKDEYIVVNIPKVTYEAVQTCGWAGRCQILRHFLLDIYLDGAHTLESMELCANWFRQQHDESSFKSLIFHTTHGRRPEGLMKLLLDFKFDMALFVPNIAYSEAEARLPSDQMDLNTTMEEKMDICKEQSRIWQKLLTENNNGSNLPTKIVRTFTNVSDALTYIDRFSKTNKIDKPQILITGSLLLVGAALTVLDPSLMRSHSKEAIDYLIV